MKGFLVKRFHSLCCFANFRICWAELSNLEELLSRFNRWIGLSFNDIFQWVSTIPVSNFTQF